VVLVTLAGVPSSLSPAALAAVAPPAAVAFASDEVVRVIDANAIKLKRMGIVRLAGAATPTRGLPDCFAYSPSAHVRRLLPPRARVQVRLTDAERHLAIVRNEGPTSTPSVNEALVAGGWAKATRAGVDDALAAALTDAQAAAQSRRLGLWVACENVPKAMEVFYEDIMGEPIIEEQPTPVRDRCGEYPYFEDALKAFKLAPQRLARLDADGNGVPCAGLPHRPQIELRQFKVAPDKRR
jgi:endonuclease YncB( thermonuclease family)